MGNRAPCLCRAGGRVCPTLAKPGLGVLLLLLRAWDSGLAASRSRFFCSSASAFVFSASVFIFCFCGFRLLMLLRFVSSCLCLLLLFAGAFACWGFAFCLYVFPLRVCFCVCGAAPAITCSCRRLVFPGLLANVLSWRAMVLPPQCRTPVAGRCHRCHVADKGSSAAFETTAAVGRRAGRHAESAAANRLWGVHSASLDRKRWH